MLCGCGDASPSARSKTHLRSASQDPHRWGKSVTTPCPACCCGKEMWQTPSQSCHPASPAAQWRLLIRCCFIPISHDPAAIGASHAKLRGRRMLSKAKSSAFSLLSCQAGILHEAAEPLPRAKVTLAKPALSSSLHMGSAVKLYLALIIWKTQKVKAGLELGALWNGFCLRMCLFTSPENLLAKYKHLLKKMFLDHCLPAVSFIEIFMLQL